MKISQECTIFDTMSTLYPRAPALMYLVVVTPGDSHHRAQAWEELYFISNRLPGPWDDDVAGRSIK